MGKVIIEFNKYLQVGKTNVEYDKIWNCNVVKPTYEKDVGLYNSEFFLDKRLGLKEFVSAQYEYTDDLELYGYKYYLYHDDTKMYVGVKQGVIIKQLAEYNYDSKNPIRFATGRSANGIVKENELTVTNGARIDNPTDKKIINEDSVYEDGYIVLDVGLGKNISAGDYVLFKDNVYAGATVQVDLYEAGKIYIMGINKKGSIPLNGDKIAIYSDTGYVPVVGTKDGVFVLHIDKDNDCATTNILPGNIDDVESFNEELFVLKGEVVYWSQRTFDDNVQFYRSTDKRRIRGAYKLISKGKFLLLMGYDNRLITPAVENSSTTGDYSFYPLNYNSRLYSKYSYLFVQSTLYLFQSNKTLVKVNISSLNATAFNLDTDNVIKTVRGLADDIPDYNSPDKGEVFANSNVFDNKLHFFYQFKDGTTTEFEYDEEYIHWLLHSYKQKIYKKSDQYLCSGYVCNIEGYKDLGVDYEQSINFILKIPSLITKVGLIRNIMGINNDLRLDYNIDIDVESSHSLTKKHINVKDMTFDTMPVDHSLDILDLLGNGSNNKHDGSIASIQRTIMMSGRYHRYNINSKNRFIYGYSYILAQPSNIFVNERNFSK